MLMSHARVTFAQTAFIQEINRHVHTMWPSRATQPRVQYCPMPIMLRIQNMHCLVIFFFLGYIHPQHRQRLSMFESRLL